MTTMNWDAPATLLERDDGGSEMYFEFREVRKAGLGDVIGDVLTMSAMERARVVIDAGAIGTFNIGEILKLAERPDFPSRGA